MTASPAGDVRARARALDATGRRRLLATLCFTQITGWGVLFYAFPVLQGGIATDTGWTATFVASTFTLGQVVAALGGVAVGWLLDRRGPRALMTVGSLAAVVATVLVATARTPMGFAIAWTAAGGAMACTLYGPAFAAVTRWFDGPDRLRALTVLTVVGGLASTVYAPLAAQLHGHLGWRGTYLVLACLLAATVPAHWWGLRRPWPASAPDTAPHLHAPSDVLLTRPFLTLAAAFAITALCATATVVGLVPLLREHGVPLETAGLVVALGGIGQVAGRLAYPRGVALLSPVGRLVLVLGLLAATTGLLGALRAVQGVVLVVLVAGTARGALTLLRATVVTERWGTARYAQLTGVLSMPVALAGAAGPWAGAQLADRVGSHATAFLVLAGLNAAAVGLAVMSHPRGERRPGAGRHPGLRRARARR